MNFLGMGPMELVLIMVLALIVFGPGKLPEIAGQIGKMVRDFRNATSEMSTEFNRAFSVEGEGTKPSPTSTPPPPTLPSVSETIATPPQGAVDRTGVADSSPSSSGTRRHDLQPPY